MTGVLPLNAPAMMALLSRPGEGLAYLTQLGVDLAPALTEDEAQRVRDATAEGTLEPDGEQAVLLTALAHAVQRADTRVTLVAELPLRRSFVCFRGDVNAAIIIFSGDSILAGLTSLEHLRTVVDETVAEASKLGVRWSLARWRGGRREIAASASDGTVLIGGSNREAARSAAAAESLAGVCGVILGP